ncbi:hypothetical protein LTR85_004422 [Meristemomyces frigidus]|nr:hypothetical protein LTR85_004422 [Meristemomyces frigidus]
MLEPITALGLASSVIQLVDFGFKTAARGRELATKGATAENAHLATITKDLIELCTELDTQTGAGAVGDGEAQQSSQSEEGAKSAEAIKALARSAKDVADELASLLQGLSLNKPGENGEPPTKRRRTVASRLVKSVWKDKELQGLRIRITSLQQEMILRLSVMQW